MSSVLAALILVLALVSVMWSHNWLLSLGLMLVALGIIAVTDVRDRRRID